MDDANISHRLRAVIAELDEVRRSLMADEPRRKTYMQAVRAKSDAEALLSEIEGDSAIMRIAAE